MSPIIRPDTSQATDFEASVPGTYRARIISIELVKGKEKGTNGIKPFFEFSAPKLTAPEAGERVVTRNSWLPTEGKGSYQFDQLLRCAGFETEAEAIKNATPDNPAEFDTDVLIQREVFLVVTTGAYTPKGSTTSRLQDEIQSFLPI